MTISTPVLTDTEEPQVEELVVKCAWCGKTRTPDNHWAFHRISIPSKNISHGICEACHKEYFQLEKHDPETKKVKFNQAAVDKPHLVKLLHFLTGA